MNINKNIKLGLSENYFMEEFLNLKEKLERVINAIKQSISNKKRINNKEMVKATKNESSLNNRIHELINTLNNFEIRLNQMGSFKKEYHSYCSMQNMAIYILKKEDLITLENVVFISNMILSFLDVISYKNDEEYDEKYKILRSDLIEWKQYFYDNIYTPSKYYDEKSLSEIRNILRLDKGMRFDGFFYRH